MVDGDTIVGGPRNISVDNVRKTSLAVHTDGGFGPHTLVPRACNIITGQIRAWASFCAGPQWYTLGKFDAEATEGN